MLKQIKKIQSANYGEYNVELIGIIDFDKVLRAPFKFAEEWMTNFHHVSYFNNNVHVVTIEPESKYRGQGR